MNQLDDNEHGDAHQEKTAQVKRVMRKRNKSKQFLRKLTLYCPGLPRYLEFLENLEFRQNFFQDAFILEKPGILLFCLKNLESSWNSIFIPGKILENRLLYAPRKLLNKNNLNIFRAFGAPSLIDYFDSCKNGSLFQ